MLEFILLKSGMIQGCPLFLLHFCMVLGILAASIKHEKEMYWVELGKRSQMSLMHKQYGIIYNRAKNIVQKTSRNNQQFQDKKSTYRNQQSFCTPTKMMLRNQTIDILTFTQDSEAIKYLAKTLTKKVKDLYNENFKSLKKMRKLK